MISNRALNKLKNKILFTLYNNYCSDNETTLDNLIFSGLFIATNPKYINIDEHDLYIALRNLVADGFITVTFKEHEEWENVTITPSGISYCQINKENKLFKYLKANHLAIVAIIISIIALFKP